MTKNIPVVTFPAITGLVSVMAGCSLNEEPDYQLQPRWRNGNHDKDDTCTTAVRQPGNYFFPWDVLTENRYLRGDVTGRSGNVKETISDNREPVNKGSPRPGQPEIAEREDGKANEDPDLCPSYRSPDRCRREPCQLAYSL